MKYMMFVVTSLEPDAELDESDVDLWVDPLDASGKRVIGEALEPASASTVVKVRGGKVLTTRGPFAETSEVIVGFDILEVENLYEAIAIASRHPMARNGQLELRPFMVWAT
ncbi:YciI family protein [uncultured Microbacterium sp.]|uniref:YciI family protein n=1 Tax=uncultured Microbacterium sp. TaxID=191216 RepID=UPI0035C95449